MDKTVDVCIVCLEKPPYIVNCVNCICFTGTSVKIIQIFHGFNLCGTVILNPDTPIARRDPIDSSSSPVLTLNAIYELFSPSALNAAFCIAGESECCIGSPMIQ